MFFVYFCQTIGKEENTSDMRIEEILAMEIGDRQFCRTEIQADDVERVLRQRSLPLVAREGTLWSYTPWKTHICWNVLQMPETMVRNASLRHRWQWQWLPTASMMGRGWKTVLL